MVIATDGVDSALCGDTLDDVEVDMHVDAGVEHIHRDTAATAADPAARYGSHAPGKVSLPYCPLAHTGALNDATSSSTTRRTRGSARSRFTWSPSR